MLYNLNIQKHFILSIKNIIFSQILDKKNQWCVLTLETLGIKTLLKKNLFLSDKQR